MSELQLKDKLKAIRDRKEMCFKCGKIKQYVKEVTCLIDKEFYDSKPLCRFCRNDIEKYNGFPVLRYNTYNGFPTLKYNAPQPIQYTEEEKEGRKLFATKRKGEVFEENEIELINRIRDSAPASGASASGASALKLNMI